MVSSIKYIKIQKGNQVAKGYEQHYFADEEPELTDDELGGQLYRRGGSYHHDERFAEQHWREEQRIQEEAARTTGVGDPEGFNREIRPNGGSDNRNVSDDPREEPVPVG